MTLRMITSCLSFFHFLCPNNHSSNSSSDSQLLMETFYITSPPKTHPSADKQAQALAGDFFSTLARQLERVPNQSLGVISSEQNAHPKVIIGPPNDQSLQIETYALEKAKLTNGKTVFTVVPATQAYTSIRSIAMDLLHANPEVEKMFNIRVGTTTLKNEDNSFFRRLNGELDPSPTASTHHKFVVQLNKKKKES